MELEQLELKQNRFKEFGTTDLNEVWKVTSYDRENKPFEFEIPLKAMIYKLREFQNKNNTISELISQINLKSTI